jgi:hypothetical protein
MAVLILIFVCAVMMATAAHAPVLAVVAWTVAVGVPAALIRFGATQRSDPAGFRPWYRRW